VLLTTLPNEPHALGLLLAEAVMRLEGARCTPLGAQTPESQILAGVRAGGTDIVALSFSGYFGLAQMREAIGKLRAALPARVALWCGGAATARIKKPPTGVLLLPRLNDIAPSLVRWREKAPVRPVLRS
jgi:cobalamin-dependent methionine synthase I